MPTRTKPMQSKIEKPARKTMQKTAVKLPERPVTPKKKAPKWQPEVSERATEGEFRAAVRAAEAYGVTGDNVLYDAYVEYRLQHPKEPWGGFLPWYSLVPDDVSL